jgi:hypothetical protein
MPLDLPEIVAGMPTVSLTDVARLRLEVVSFFLMGLLISAGVVMIVWNLLRRDFAWLPWLSYSKACGVVILWGLLFVVVLTMISGARELMTPGAWEKTGATYKLRKSPGAVATSASGPSAERREKLHSLYRDLLQFALRHDGALPQSREEAELSESVWSVPGFAGTEYVYLPGGQVDGPPRPLAYEPEVFDGDLLVLMTDGQTRLLPLADILRLAEAPP